MRACCGPRPSRERSHGVPRGALQFDVHLAHDTSPTSWPRTLQTIAAAHFDSVLEKPFSKNRSLKREGLILIVYGV
jgi:hypothetical protein